MFHSNRRWCIAKVGSAEELAGKLTETIWCCCTGFELDKYLWLNDSTSPDDAQEYAIVKRQGPKRKPVQIESITFRLCDHAKSLGYIEHTLAGLDDQNSFRRSVEPILETPEAHGRCSYCA
ncbi:MAG: hypothetical protein EXS05_19550 [Planctomycetaceae bacterium]|nr:hypothetical protein [Planctomycetaceae bacterium]